MLENQSIRQENQMPDWTKHDIYLKRHLPSDYKQHDVPAVLDTIVNLFPHNIADSWANNQVVPIVLFAILTSLAYNAAACV